jgi:hypothetical protein
MRVHFFAFMRILRRSLAVALCSAFFFSGCAWHRHKRPRAAEDPSGPRRVGTVASVNEALQFVLIDVGSLYAPEPGTALKSFSHDQQTGILAVNPERRRPFIAADIIEGEPKVGDEVRE